MKCVKCEGKLGPVQIDDVEVDQCNQCGGIWFDALELKRVLGHGHVEALEKRGAPRRDDDARRGHCPRCGGSGYMVRLASADTRVHIDTCAVCGGQWLDGGEIDVLDAKGPLHRLRRLVRRVLDFDLG